MKVMEKLCAHVLPVLIAALLAGCGRADAPKPGTSGKHEHKPPHGGTPVVLGNEEYHLELVLDGAAGRLQAYVLDGELENFIRVPEGSFEIHAKLPSKSETLVFRAVASSATGETVADTSLFEAQADWLKATTAFDAVLKELIVRGRKYENVAFNFPKGNDIDEKENK